MTWPYEASVIHRAGKDYWRTWFLEECESVGLFGINEKHLPLLKTSGLGFSAYRVGTEVFLEDAPYFKASESYHRVCGPYKVVAAQLPPGAKPVYMANDKVIIYKEPHPELGPWPDRSRVTRRIDGVTVSFPQIAGKFGYYPYRFAIMRGPEFKIDFVPHEENDCWLCVHGRNRRGRSK
jgi:hypothetical protein